MAWDPSLSAAEIAEEWIRQTLSNDPNVVASVRAVMLASHQAVVDYMTPLGLAHLMASNHHYGPGPWVSDLGRADWNPVYYHRADADGIGFDRTASGSNAVAQYAPELRATFASREAIPDDYLLFFHHVGWSETLRSGRTLWNELVDRYSTGVTTARAMRDAWARVRGRIDDQRFNEISGMLQIQADEAKWWRDASLQYFGSIAGRELPPGAEPADHPLEFYRALTCPADRDRPRCPEIYSE
jgi:alpha-glucuronidase